MPKTWYAVLSQSSMKLFERDAEDGSFQHRKTLRNSLVGSKSKDLARHKPGRMAKGGKGSMNFALTSGESPKVDATRDFARRIAKFLDGERKRETYSDLCVAAEPKFLGMVKEAMSKETIRSVQTWLRKDLAKFDGEELSKAFKK